MEKKTNQFDYLAHYTIDAEEFDYFEIRSGATFHEEKRVREMLALQVSPNTFRILDIGCGRGWVAEEFIPQKKQVISLDISKKNPSQINKKHYDEKFNVPIVGDSFSLPFISYSVDCIIASEVIEHVIDPESFIEELFRVLKKGGKLIISTPYREEIRYYLCIHCNKKSPVNGHLHSFDERSLRDLYKKNDLKKIYYKIFGNKFLIYMRTHIILKYLPLKIWLLIDMIANKIYNKPLHIVFVYEKQN
jgi:ubiquinone/menaquinone biosynthesis C-methylase UbiE